MSIDIHSLISHYGYLALVIGCMAEGETFVLLGGIAAHEGLLHLYWVIAAAMVGGIIGDQILFFLGWRYGTKFLTRFEKQQSKIDKANTLIHRHPALFVIGARFMYGFRIIGPIIIGSSGLHPWLFVLLNIIGAALWAGIFASLGFYAGKIITPWLNRIEGYLEPLFWIAVAALVIWGMWKLIQWLRTRNSPQ
ncbi:DedA family protein [Rosenbergiella nectarea]|uniref:DedA family protein n=1 Tax=Rosenbergiella nectarea TaxID=988801 RepID=UPI001F4E4470|nr:DedA family protein [Rosenbergiella nectarea]